MHTMPGWRRGLLIPGGLAVLAGLLWWWWQPLNAARSSVQAHDAAQAVAANNTPPSEHPFDPAWPMEATATLAHPLPPMDAPPAQVISELLPRARAGEGRAACRIAVELIACAEASQLGYLENLSLPVNWDALEQLPAEQKHLIEEAGLEQVETLLALHGQCRDLPPTGKTINQWLLQGVAAGHVESALGYIDGHGLIHAAPGLNDPVEAMRIIGNTEFAAWHRDAPVLAEALAAQGVSGAAFMLQVAYEMDGGLFASRVPDDPVKAEAYHRLFQKIQGKPHRSPRQVTLSPEQQAAVEALVAQLQAKLSALDPAVRERNARRYFFSAGALNKVMKRGPSQESEAICQ